MKLPDGLDMDEQLGEACLDLSWDQKVKYWLKDQKNLNGTVLSCWRKQMTKMIGS